MQQQRADDAALCLEREYFLVDSSLVAITCGGDVSAGEDDAPDEARAGRQGVGTSAASSSAVMPYRQVMPVSQP